MPLRPCSHVGCRELVKKGRCKKHQRGRSHDKHRGTAAQRGYGGRWQRYRAGYLSRNPLCVMCQDKGIITPATVVDHIKPVSDKGDPLFWQPDNHQPLCRECHQYKTTYIDGLGYGSKPPSANEK